MAELPPFWRDEIWHPLSVHFPIALLLMALVFKAIAFGHRNMLWDRGGFVLLFIGTLAAWVSVLSGNWADGAVARELCDPTVLKDHENASYAVSWVFTSALMAEFIFRFWQKNGLKWIQFILMLVGSGFLIYTGHLGASLVYQQGAGVYMPTENCEEFE